MKKISFAIGLAILALTVGNCIGAPTILVKGLSATMNQDRLSFGGESSSVELFTPRLYCSK